MKSLSMDAEHTELCMSDSVGVSENKLPFHTGKGGNVDENPETGL